jgi:hypothetical protein
MDLQIPGPQTQVFFGNRDWYILDRKDVKPLIVKDTYPNILQSEGPDLETRQPSNVENIGDTRNVIGEMDYDEDLEQAQYNVMTLIDQRLKQQNKNISEMFNLSINNRLVEVENMMNTFQNEVQELKDIDVIQEIAIDETGLNYLEPEYRESMDRLINYMESSQQHTELLENIQNRLNNLENNPNYPGSQENNPNYSPGSQGPSGSQYVNSQGRSVGITQERDSLGPNTHPESYGKMPGKYYYPKMFEKNDVGYEIFDNYYKKYKGWPYFFDLSDQKTKEFLKKLPPKECKSVNDDNNNCEKQIPNLKCVNGVPLTDSDGKILIKDDDKNDIKLFIKPEKSDLESCNIKYDPDTKTYKCGDLEYQNLMYPYPTVNKGICIDQIINPDDNPDDDPDNNSEKYSDNINKFTWITWLITLGIIFFYFCIHYFQGGKQSILRIGMILFIILFILFHSWVFLSHEFEFFGWATVPNPYEKIYYLQNRGVSSDIGSILIPVCTLTFIVCLLIDKKIFASMAIVLVLIGLGLSGDKNDFLDQLLSFNFYSSFFGDECSKSIINDEKYDAKEEIKTNDYERILKTISILIGITLLYLFITNQLFLAPTYYRKYLNNPLD